MFFFRERNQYKTVSRRAVFILLSKSILFSFVGWKLYKLQITNSEKYKTLSKNNRINLKIVFPSRGLIVDRNNVVLARNLETYNLYIVPEQTNNLDLVLKKLSMIIPLNFDQRKKVINLSKKMQKFEMIRIIDNLNWSQLEKIEAYSFDLPGLQLLSSNKRDYPYKNYFSHIIGYTSKPSKKDLKLPYISSMPTLEIGKTGIEKQFNEI